MEFKDFLTQVIDRGIEGAKRDYTSPDQQAILKGSLAGFEACRKKDVLQLSILLTKARQDAEEFRKSVGTQRTQEQMDKYWELRGYELEVEWVCNVVSASLYNQKLPVIITPTARGMMMAAEILGVSESKSTS